MEGVNAIQEHSWKNTERKEEKRKKRNYIGQK